jgi:protein-tyrosine phosphatase
MDSSFKWLPISGGHLAIGHRPKKSAIATKLDGTATHILTLLSEREGAEAIGEATERAGLRWLWLPLSNGNPAEANEAATRSMLKQVRQALMSGAKVFIHCSAGIHRTGMITAALLRSLDLTREESEDLLRNLRDATAAGVGHTRLAWTDRFSTT